MSREVARAHGRLPLGDGQHVRRPSGRGGRDRAPTSSGCSRSASPERAAALGEHLGLRLRELEAAHPCVAEVAGAGLLWAVELVAARRLGRALRPGRPPRARPPGQPRFSPSLLPRRRVREARRRARDGAAEHAPARPAADDDRGAHRRSASTRSARRSTSSPRSAPRALACGLSVADAGRLPVDPALGCSPTCPRSAHSLAGREVTGAPRLLVDGALVAARATAARSPSSTRPPARRSASPPTGRAADMERAIAAARRAFDDARLGERPRAPCPLPAPAPGSDARRGGDAPARPRRRDRLRGADDVRRPARPADREARLLRRPRRALRYDTRLDDGDGPAGNWLFREPVGVVGAITPWNIPIELDLAKVGAALAAGCTVVLKPSPLSPWSATHLGRLVAERTEMPAGRLQRRLLVLERGRRAADDRPARRRRRVHRLDGDRQAR